MFSISILEVENLRVLERQIAVAVEPKRIHDFVTQVTYRNVVLGHQVGEDLGRIWSVQLPMLHLDLDQKSAEVPVQCDIGRSYREVSVFQLVDLASAAFDQLSLDPSALHSLVEHVIEGVIQPRCRSAM